MNVLVASRNPVKLDATRDALALLKRDADVRGEAVTVDVPDQPMGDDATRAGAAARAEALPRADLRIGIEGGLCPAPGRPGKLDAMAWVVALDTAGRRGMARTATFELPPALTKLIREGLELGDADDRVFGHVNNKQAGGTVGTLTHGAITRRTYYAPAIALALLPIVREELYDGQAG